MTSRPPEALESISTRSADQDWLTRTVDTRVWMLLRAFVLALAVGLVLGMATTLTLRRAISAARDAVSHFGDHHNQ